MLKESREYDEDGGCRGTVQTGAQGLAEDGNAIEDNSFFRVVSGICRSINKIVALLGCYAVVIGSYSIIYNI